ncbi:uncharacterized protein LAJ45_09490 [Morchella importuna]|uniref:uncharacterized protein n=1 Tax=Morchella importuna TaxID=1174673 RepID=UPI001E8D9BFA|nr:uncharacterized protein LAJ45_09490 [Morchella importuna]KAH8146544.1 hypothetical protein LAJ45_09490 [Morchella importuna]
MPTPLSPILLKPRHDIPLLLRRRCIITLRRMMEERFSYTHVIERSCDVYVAAEARWAVVRLSREMSVRS